MTINIGENSLKEIIFWVEEDGKGGYIAKAIGESIFTQADSIQELRGLIKDAVHCHYPDEQNRPKLIRLHIVREEVMAS
jgi:predicted RNase H-like HicB family nuclease